ncbi:MAG: 50S ribosomal protein L22 [Bacilli bacterium]
MEAKAILRKSKIAPRKVRLTIDLIRGKNTLEALSILKNTNTKASELIEKVLLSAIANAENNLELDKEKLVVKEAFVDEGPTLKRVNPRSKGRADRIIKRTSHITIKVAERN